MQSILAQLNRYFEAAPGKLLPYRWTVVLSFFVLTALLVYGMATKFVMDMSLESWFKDDDPVKVSLDNFRSQFGSDDGVYVVYRTSDGDVFSEQSIALIKSLHEELDNIRLGLTLPEGLEESNELSRIDRIDSLYNARYQIADGDTLISKKLLANDYPETQAAREAARAIARDQDGFHLAYYSDDFQYGGIRLKTDFGAVPKDDQVALQTGETDLLAEDDFDMEDSFDGGLDVDTTLEAAVVDFKAMEMEEYLYFMRDLRVVTEQDKYAELEFFFTGQAAMMEFFMENMIQASALMGLMLLAVIVLLWALFRSWSAVFWPVVVIACSAFWSIGLMSWLDIALSNMVTLSFMLILAVGVADCVHVLSAYMLYRREGHEHRDAMTKAYRKTGLPIFLTTITTMAGMGALMLSSLPQIVIFGLNSALGVLVAFIFTIFLLPVLLDIWHPYNSKVAARVKANKRYWMQSLLDHIPGFISRHFGKTLAVYVVIFGGLLYGASQIRVDTNFAELAAEDSYIRTTYNIVDENMMGGQNMEFMLTFGQRDALKDPEVLKVIAAIQERMETAYPEFVVKTISLADVVEDTNEVMHEGRDEYNTIPDDPRLTAQLLFLFDNANADDRRELVNDDYTKSHISLTLKNKGSYEYADFFESAQQDIDEYFAPLQAKYPEMEVKVTGSLALMMQLVDYINWAQIKSFSFALGIITLLLTVSLGSVQAGLISMIPNLLPAFFTFGLMGLLGVPLDTDTLIIAPVIIGIAVDDTIHFIAHYRDAWYETGDVDTALASTIKEVGQAVTMTTLILGVGFSMLAFSDYLGLAKTGIFGSLAIFVALCSDLFLFPALIKWLKPDLGRKRYLAKLAKTGGRTACDV